MELDASGTDGPIADRPLTPREGDRFVSYAQNYEDVMLWRALGHIQSGFYVDLGAGEPSADSVTKAFYDRGWSGVNVEPMDGPFERLAAERPRDINLKLAIEEKATETTYYSVDFGNGLSTGLAVLADQYRSSGRNVDEVTVSTLSLQDVCEAYVTRPVHFLKIDVEGSEERILQGADLRQFRPWVIVCEAVAADADFLSAGSTRRAIFVPPWDALLTEAGYDFLYFDGINRYYSATERTHELRDAFLTPPNFFDNFVRAAELEAIELGLQLCAAEATASAAFSENMARVAEISASLDERARLIAENASLLEHLDAARAAERAAQQELESCYQELFEDSRQIGWLSVQRANGLTHIQRAQAALEHYKRHVEFLETQVETLRETTEVLERALTRHAEAEMNLRVRERDLLQSTSWRLSAPVRWASRRLSGGKE